MYIRKKATLKKDIAKKIICAVMVVICVNGILSSCYKAPDYFTTEYCMEQYDETMPNLACLKTKNRTDDVINNIWFYSIKGVSIDEFIEIEEITVINSIKPKSLGKRSLANTNVKKSCRSPGPTLPTDVQRKPITAFSFNPILQSRVKDILFQHPLHIEYYSSRFC